MVIEVPLNGRLQANAGRSLWIDDSCAHVDAVVLEIMVDILHGVEMD
jgi:hypothetical protein